MLYEGKPVDLTPEQEEVASMFAIMKETDYMSKPTFLKNFWEGFKEVCQQQQQQQQQLLQQLLHAWWPCRQQQRNQQRDMGACF
jgi:hypothetical protein